MCKFGGSVGGLWRSAGADRGRANLDDRFEAGWAWPRVGVAVAGSAGERGQSTQVLSHLNQSKHPPPQNHRRTLVDQAVDRKHQMSSLLELLKRRKLD